MYLLQIFLAQINGAASGPPFAKEREKVNTVEFHHLIKELQSFPDGFHVYFGTSVVQFNALLLILEPPIFIILIQTCSAKIFDI